MTTPQKTTKINPWYARCAMEEMLIDMDQDGLFCQMPSESDASTLYTVRVDESGVAPVATSCNCDSKKHCKHMTLVNSYYARIYKTNIAKHEAKQAKTQQEQVKQEVAQVTSTPAPVRMKQPVRRDRFASSLDYCPTMTAAPRSSDVGSYGCLNVSRPFQLMR